MWQVDLRQRLLGEDRVVTFDEPGTTRDSIYILFESNGKALHPDRYRRRATSCKISETIEKSSLSSRRCRLLSRPRDPPGASMPNRASGSRRRIGGACGRERAALVVDQQVGRAER